MAKFVLGIDGGGSKTEALLVDIVTGERFSQLAGGINSLADDAVFAQEHLAQLVGLVKDRLQREPGDLLGICIGSAAILHDDEAEHWSVQLLAQAFPGVPTVGVIDTRIALEGALGGQPGVVIVAGTGSIAYAKDENGTTHRCGGWGPIFGDEGSGYWIGCEALRSAARQLDGRGGRTALGDEVMRRLNAHATKPFIDAVYGKMVRSDVAKLTEVVGDCARRGDEEALRILAEAGRHLAELARTIAAGTTWTTTPEIAYTGGVFRIGEPVLKPFLTHLGDRGSSVRRALHSPACGAALLAGKKFGIPLPDWDELRR